MASAQLAVRTCRKGHPLVGRNLYVSPRGKRQCRTCKRVLERERYYRIRRKYKKDRRTIRDGPTTRLVCVNGHWVIGDNLWFRSEDGYRRCRQCRIEAYQRTRQRNRVRRRRQRDRTVAKMTANAWWSSIGCHVFRGDCPACQHRLVPTGWEDRSLLCSGCDRLWYASRARYVRSL